MRLLETLRTSVRSLNANRTRTALTALGMIIGVAAVVAVLGVGQGARASVEDRIRSLGANLLFVRPGAPQRGRVRTGSVETLTTRDADQIGALPGVVAVAPEASASAQVEHLANNTSATVTGTTPAFLTVRSANVATGIGLTDVDLLARRRVAVLGREVADELDATVGARIQIRGQAFTVVGVLAAKGDRSVDDAVIVPLTTHQGALFGQDHLSGMSVQVETEEASAAVQARIEQLLRLRHRIRPGAEDDFSVRSQAEMLEAMGEVTGTFTALLAAVAAVSLLVGGIGIMNIMLVSVQERTREIGVRMAVGARRRDVLLQFLVEALIVSLFGGVLGLTLGHVSADLISRLGGWATEVPVYANALALGTAAVVGVVFGVGPARRAAALDPVEALRHE